MPWLTNKILASFEQKEYCSAVFLDIQRASNKFWHSGLLCTINMFLHISYFPFFKLHIYIYVGVPQGSGSTEIHWCHISTIRWRYCLFIIKTKNGVLANQMATQSEYHKIGIVTRKMYKIPCPKSSQNQERKVILYKTLLKTIWAFEI